MRKLLTVGILIVAGAAMASATAFNCADGVTDVNSNAAVGPGANGPTGGLGTGSGNQCFVTGAASVLFSNFSVNASAGFTAYTVGIRPGAGGTPPGGGNTGLVGGNILLDFQLGGCAGPGCPGNGDVLMFYQVDGGIQGVDMTVQATPTNGGSLTIIEIVCAVAFVSNACPGAPSNTLANYSITSNGQTVSDFRTFASTGQVFIKKDIQFNGASISEFVNSQTIPEPMTLSLMGLGLLGLGLIGRRVRK
jgi:hypothetical protein